MTTAQKPLPPPTKSIIQHRLPWIDDLKGFGIILVVCGHVLASGVATHLIYFFHMPLFFWVSGYLFRIRDNRELFLKLLRGLVVPYIAFLVLVTLLDFAQSLLTGHSTSLPLGNPLRATAIAVYGGSKLSAAYSVFWFLPCLGVSTFMLNFILRRFKPLSWECGVIFALLAAGGYAIGHFALPLAVNIVPTAMVIMWFGTILRTHLPTNLKSSTIALLLCGAVGLLGSFVFAPMDMKNGAFGTPIGTLVTSTVLIVSLALLAQVLPLPRFATLLLTSLGKASLVIMFLHQVINVALGPATPGYEKLVVCVLVPYLFYLAAERSALARQVFLGGR